MRDAADRRLVRLGTVLVYLLSVSLSAGLLGVYYGLLWRPGPDRTSSGPDPDLLRTDPDLPRTGPDPTGPDRTPSDMSRCVTDGPGRRETLPGPGRPPDRPDPTEPPL
ncbi:putative transmembrane protein INAFM2 [Anoplopoma fimbria]|uniref:putative transmembrane protein INAFM2 n=1 Tax=Anoplopoma fimbria TaxID=229290 RepID=UPI0023EBDCE8|nr:putative transmembrane protein INAFM2 [Anoplopoma fimbria]